MNTYGAAPFRILLDNETRIVAIDGQLAADLGHGAEDLLEGPFSAIVATGHIADIGKDLITLVTGEKPAVTAQRSLRTIDDTEITAVVSAEARRVDDQLVGFSLAVLIDDDAHATPVLMPDHLRRVNMAAALVDADGALVDTNPAWGQLFGTTEAVTPGADVFALVHDEERDKVSTQLGEVARGATPSTKVELRCRHDDGTFWARWSIAPFNGRPTHLTISAEDISAEHLTNRVLSANEALFRSLAEASPVGLARLAPDLSITYASPSWRSITGGDDSEQLEDLGAVLYAADRLDALEAFRDRVANASDQPVVARLSTSSDGAPRWASLRLGQVEDGEVGVIGYVVTVEDVTDLIASNESQVQLADVVETTSDLVGIADLATGEVLYLNAAAEEQFGPLGADTMHLRDVYSPESVELYSLEIYPVLRRGETWAGDLDMVRNDGSIIRVRQTIAAQVNRDGEPERASVLGRDVSDEQQALDELAHKATHDTLTGLPNRSLLIDHLELALARSARDRRPVAVLFVDLDRFKIINDTHGHDAGDAMLQRLGEDMAAVLRPSDTVARLGGDEFVVLCEDIDGETDALTIAARVLRAVEDARVDWDGNSLSVGASIGIAISNGGEAGREPSNLLQRADAAMYRAKEEGRGRIELFDDVRRDRAKRRAEQTDQLAQAIDDGALDVHYQPIVDLETGKVAGVEALVRWLHPTAGLLGPSEFLPLAIETGLVMDLDALVLRRAVSDAQAWVESGRAPDLRVHVNLDGQTVMSGRVGGVVDEALRRSGLPAHHLCLELSEPFMMANGDDVVDEVASLSARGLSIAIDDVGTGATQLPRLNRFAIDVLKIDGSLSGAVESSDEAGQLIGGIVALGQALGLEVGAECVETEASIPILRELGVRVAQGHVFSAALPAAKVETLLPLRSTLARADR